METISSVEEFERILNSNIFVFAYLSNQSCNVCKVLKPKVEELLNEFDEIKTVYADLSELSEISGKLLAFSVPTLIFFVEGKEYLRESRNISIYELENKLKRILQNIK